MANFPLIVHGTKLEKTLSGREPQYQEIKSWGINTIHISGQITHEESFAQLKDHGLKIIEWVTSSIVKGESKPGYIEFAAKQWALWGWHIFEEPNLRYYPHEWAKNKYNRLKARDPEHPAFGIYALGDPVINYYPQYMDYVCGDVYVPYRDLDWVIHRFWWDTLKNLNKPYIACIEAQSASEMIKHIEYFRNLVPNLAGIMFYDYSRIISKGLQPAVREVCLRYGGVIDSYWGPTYTKETVTCPQCSSSLELTKSSEEAENIPQICPVCGENVGVGYIVRIITELPWPPEEEEEMKEAPKEYHNELWKQGYRIWTPAVLIDDSANRAESLYVAKMANTTAWGVQTNINERFGFKAGKYEIYARIRGTTSDIPWGIYDVTDESYKKKDWLGGIKNEYQTLFLTEYDHLWNEDDIYFYFEGRLGQTFYIDWILFYSPEYEKRFPPEVPIAEILPWYKKYAPHLVVGGILASIITYCSLKEKD